MEDRKKKQIRSRILIASIAVIGVALAYILYVAFVKKKLGPDYYIVLYGCLAVFWFLSDVLTIILTKGFEGKTEGQKKAYRIYAALNFLGLAGLGYFAFTINSSNGMIGVFIYVATLMMKRKYQDEYRGVSGEGAEDSEEEAEQTKSLPQAGETDDLEETQEETQKGLQEESGKELL